MNYVKASLFLLFFAVSVCHAQRGNISIEQEPGIAELLKLYEKNISAAGFFTIQVGFGKYSEAQELKDNAELDFPQWTARIVFDSPTYRVQIGRFRNRMEAEREYLEVRKKYPGALILKPEKKEEKR